jgi:hypothetical protein
LNARSERQFVAPFRSSFSAIALTCGGLRGHDAIKGQSAAHRRKRGANDASAGKAESRQGASSDQRGGWKPVFRPRPLDSFKQRVRIKTVHGRLLYERVMAQMEKLGDD